MSDAGSPSPGPHRNTRLIEELAGLSPGAEVTERLREIAGTYGRVMAVSQMATIAHRDEDIHLYRVCFERTVDAMTASRELNCYLLGFSTLVVQVRQRGQAEGARPGLSSLLVGHPESQPVAAGVPGRIPPGLD